MKHFLKPVVKLSLLGGVLYLAASTGLSSLTETQPVAVAKFTPTNTGPQLIDLNDISINIAPEPLTVAEVFVPEMLPIAEPVHADVIVIAEVTPEAVVNAIPAVTTNQPKVVKPTLVKRAKPVQRYRVAYPLPPRMPQQYYGYNPNFENYKFPEIPAMPPMPYF
jgi:hypothetical protein